MRRINRRQKNMGGTFIRISLTAFVVLLAVYISLKIYIAGTAPRGPVADGTVVKVYVTNELNCYREPCG